MERASYHVSIADKTVSLTGNSQLNSGFEVQLTTVEYDTFMKIFQQINELEPRNAFRAHLPYIQYHDDHLNHDIDRKLMKLYALIHEYGDERGKRFVEQLPYFS